MYCRFCGTQLNDSANFCYACGAPTEIKKESKVKKFFMALLKALVYFFTCFIIEEIVIGVCTFFITIATLIPSSVVDYDSAMNLAFEAISKALNSMSCIAYVIVFLALCIFFAIRHKKPMKELHITKIKPKFIIIGLLLGISLQLFFNVVLSFIIMALPSEVTDSFTTLFSPYNSGSMVIEILNVVILTPIIEEIIFRGLVFTRLRKGMRCWIAAAIAATIFGIAHGNFLAFIYTFILGYIICIMVEKTGSIIPGICAHFAFNGGSYLLGLLPENDILIIVLFLLSIVIAAISITAIALSKKEELATENITQEAQLCIENNDNIIVDDYSSNDITNDITSDVTSDEANESETQQTEIEVSKDDAQTL